MSEQRIVRPVPFARYVARYFNELVFPFRRCRIQQVWHGEPPRGAVSGVRAS